MGIIYDNWERLVRATLKKEELRELARAHSRDPSLSSISSDSIPIFGDNMSITRQIHDCYDHYELKTYKKLFNCDGCKMKGFGERYMCNLSGQELHKECRHPEETISHENFGGSVFKFLDKPFTRLGEKNRREVSKCCDACGKDIHGFNYHCEEDNLDLHPCCRKLEKKLTIDGMIFDLRTKVSSKCGKCGKKKISRDEKEVLGWSYVSPCKKHHFHVYCITEMVQEAYMKAGANPRIMFGVGDINKGNKKIIIIKIL